jgi:hypothetical protein
MTKLLYRYDSNIKVSLMGWCCVLNTTPPLFTGRTPNDDAQLHLQTSRRIRDAVSEKRRSQTFSQRASSTVTFFSFSSYKSSHKSLQFYSFFSFQLGIRGKNSDCLKSTKTMSDVQKLYRYIDFKF